MNVYRHMVCIDASGVAYATSALTTLYSQAEQIFALKDGKPTYPADKIAHGDVICIDFSDGGKSVSALVYRQNEKNGGIVYASAITDEEGVMLTFDEDGIYKSKQKVAGGGGGGGGVTLPITITDPQGAAFTSSQSFLNLFSGTDGTGIIFYLSEVEEDAPLFGLFGANNNSIMLGRQRDMIALIVQYNEKTYGGLLPDTASYDTPTLAITGQASGIAVEANPASEATESLSKVRIEDKVYSVGGGSAPTNMVTTLHGDDTTNQVTLYHDASQLSGQTPLQLKTVGGQSLIGSGDIPLAAAQSRTSRAIYTHTISISHSNISYAIKLFTDTDTEITSATALWSALDSSLNVMYIKSENERNIVFDFSKDSSGNITLYYLDASSSMSIEVDTGDLISDNVS